MHRSITRAALGAVLLSLCPTGADAAAWQGRESYRGGVLLVENPATAMLPAATIELEELWRVGGDSEDEGEFFGVISDVAVGAGGDVFLLDQQLSEVKVFDADGEYLRTIGHEGEGPGEFRRPVSLFFFPEGDLGVAQSRPGRIVRMDERGVPGPLYPLPGPEDGGFRFVQDARSRGGSVAVLGMAMKFAEGGGERTTRLLGLGADGTVAAVFHEHTMKLEMSRPAMREVDTTPMPWALAPSGALVASLDFDYGLRIWGAGGAGERLVTLAYEPQLRSAAEMEKKRAELGAGMRFRGQGGRGGRGGGRPEVEVEVSGRERAIRWIEVAEDGRIWVLSGRGADDAPDAAIGSFHVYDGDGRFQQTVTLLGEGDLEADRILLRGDRLFVLTQYASAVRAMFGGGDEEDEVEEMEAEPMSVICYRFQAAAQVAP